MTDVGLYIHIPFCNSKCKYCSFASSVQNEKVQEQYFHKLNQEILSSKADKEIKSIFFGGGTPSAVCPSFICKTLETIKKHFIVSKNAEITLEANPNSVSAESLMNYKNAGFNRISFGVQSFEDETLKLLGRTHSAIDAFRAVELAKNLGFDNISIDLIIGANKLDKEIFKNFVSKMKQLGVTHISVYILMLEVGTKLFKEVKSGKIIPLNEEDVTNEYLFVQKALEEFGFMQYEISNFALEGKKCWHNQNYWASGEYYGFGLSAHSYLEGVRSENTSVLQDYLSLPLENIVIFKETLGKEEKITEKIMLSLRTVQGLNLSELKELGLDLLKEKKFVIENLLKNNMIEIKDNYLKILKDKFVLSNQIILELI